MAATLKRDRRAYRWLLRLAPLHALQLLQYEGAMTWLRLTRRRIDCRFKGASGLLVNLGCGRGGQNGWVNIDSQRAPGVTCVCDCRKRIPLPSASARAVFTEHLLEHLDYEAEAPVFLAECRRVLEPHGIIRIVVPDGAKYLRAYATGDWEEMRRFSPLAATRDPRRTTLMEIVNEHFRQGGQHRFSYDYETLARLLSNAGFGGIALARFGESRASDLALDNSERAAESLYVEASRA